LIHSFCRAAEYSTCADMGTVQYYKKKRILYSLSTGYVPRQLESISKAGQVCAELT
jgi:hypothetical protein